MRARLFWVISRVAILLYRHFPVFGPIPGAIAIISRDQRFLVLKRNDGLGYGFPGGIARLGEPPEKALRREVREETGLDVTWAELKFTFETSVLYPTCTSVYEALTKGEVRGSWEGKVELLSLEELDRSVMPSQREVVEYLKRKMQ